MADPTGVVPTPLCPSARPEMDGSVVFGIVGGSENPDLVAYLREPQPATGQILAVAHPVKPTAVFRFGASCAGSACAHFDGADCLLGRKIVELLPPAVEVLPRCAIRSRCRWWLQEGRQACLRCPAIATEPFAPTSELRRAADPAVGVSPGP